MISFFWIYFNSCIEPRPKANSRGELSVYYYADSSKSSQEDINGIIPIRMD